MANKEYREGETVEVVVVSRDADGKIMGEGGYTWYGMDNVAANMVTTDMFQSTIEKSKQWAAAKNGQVDVETSRQGVIR